MKTYLSVGIGDMVFLDSILTKEEKESMTEIYWACRFGKDIAPLMTDNPAYPNLVSQHFIDDEVGKTAMQSLDPVAVPFWHFRPDFYHNFMTGLSLFGLKENEVQAVNAAAMFTDRNRIYRGSSFLDYAHNNVMGAQYILLHYPTSTRPRSDIASLSNDDWKFIESLSIEHNMRVIVVSDHEIPVPLSNAFLMVNTDIRLVVSLVKHCTFYAGCDSFCAHLASKVLDKDRLFIKSHESNIKQKLLNTTFARAFMPHPPEDVALFYKPYIGYS